MNRMNKKKILEIPFIAPHRPSNFIPYEGMTFGHVSVLKEVIPFEREPNDPRAVLRYHCGCDCGTDFICERGTLTKNINNPDFNCGHLIDEWFFPIHEGDRIGHITILYNIDNYMANSGVLMGVWRCKCDCGLEFNLESRYLFHGATSCGMCEYSTNIPSSYDKLIGRVQGRLTIIGRGPDFRRSKNKNNVRVTYWCKCSCGNPDLVLIKGETLANKKMPTLSCGCLHREQAKRMGDANIIHGLSGTKIYATLQGMKRRCYDPKSDMYPIYGGRGITICPEWLEEENYAGLINFYNWSMENGYREDLSIDRIDQNGNYCPENCRWVNDITQANNKGNNLIITVGNTTYTTAQWAVATGIDAGTIYARIHQFGYDPVKAVTTPVRGTKPINAIYFVDEFGNPVGEDMPAIYFESNKNTSNEGKHNKE